MEVKYKDIVFKIKDMDSAGFQKTVQAIKIDYGISLKKFVMFNDDGNPANMENILIDIAKARDDFYYPDVKIKALTPEQREWYNIPPEKVDGTETVARFKELFTLFLDGDISKIDFSNTIGNTILLKGVAGSILNFLMLGEAATTEE